MTKVKFKNIGINKVTNSSGVNTGVNILHNWKNRTSRSEGFGIVEGKSNKIANNISFSDRKNGEY
jgi:hypothetical protein